MPSCPTRLLPAATLFMILFPETFEADPERCHAVAPRMEVAYPGMQVRAVQNRFIRPENCSHLHHGLRDDGDAIGELYAIDQEAGGAITSGAGCKPEQDLQRLKPRSINPHAPRVRQTRSGTP